MQLSRPSDALSGHSPVSAALVARWQELNAAGRIGSIRQLCAAAGISRTTWYSLQDPNRRPVRATITALADVLDMDAQPLLRLAGFGNTPPATPVPTAPDDGETER